jgi:hypothetical protein
VVRSHALKGIGAGDAITPAQLADEQRIIDAAAELFIGAVARGRGMGADKVRALATGQMWFAAAAMESGLIDAVTSTDEAHARAVRKRHGADGRPQMNTHAPSLGAKENTMQTELEELRAKLAAAEAETAALKTKAATDEAKAAALADSLKAVQASQRETLLKKYEDRLGPANRASVEKLGETMGADVAGFEKFLAGLPVVTRADRESEPADDPNDGGSVSDEDIEVATLFGFSPDLFGKFKGATHVEAHTGLVVFKDGTKREVK